MKDSHLYNWEILLVQYSYIFYLGLPSTFNFSTYMQRIDDVLLLYTATLFPAGTPLGQPQLPTEDCLEGPDLGEEERATTQSLTSFHESALLIFGEQEGHNDTSENK